MIAGSLAPNICHILQAYADAVEVNVPLGNIEWWGVRTFGDQHLATMAKLQIAPTARYSITQVF
jgi:hypothetical protein